MESQELLVVVAGLEAVNLYGLELVKGKIMGGRQDLII